MSTVEEGGGNPSGAADRRTRWVLGAVGVLVIAAGGLLLLRGAPTRTELFTAGVWLLVPPVLSDLLVLPLAAVVAAVIARRLPPPWRAPVVVGLVLTTFTLLIGWPVLGAFGRIPGNPSLLDRNYVAGTAVLLAVVWAGCLGGALLAARRSSRRVNAPDLDPGPQHDPDQEDQP